ncbi:MAG TPA: DNA polymerase III subunit delta [Acidobacteriota bacterium]|nr:DNA polymerase III subunit delta [Acidobacteriota bacterium]
MILQSLEELEAELNRGQFHCIYVVMGPEEYLCRQAVALLKHRALTPEAVAFNYVEFSCEESSAREIVEAAQTYPMMSSRRLVLVTHLERASPSDQTALLSYLDSPAERSILLLHAGDLDRRTNFCKQLREKTCVVECPKLKGYALMKWAENFFRSQGFRISQSTLKKAVDLAGEDLQSLANELEKLLIYAGKEKVVPDAALNDLVNSSRQHTVFELTKALGRRDRADALRQLANLLDSGEEALGIVSMMARHFRQILIWKDVVQQGKGVRDAAAAAQVPPFVQDEFAQHVRAIDRDTAAAMFLKLAKADYQFKSSPADKRMVLENLICSL